MRYIGAYIYMKHHTNQELFTLFPPDVKVCFIGISYESHLFQLAKFSPLVNRLLKNDPCIREIHIPFTDRTNYFKHFIKYMYSQEEYPTFPISMNNVKPIINIASFLEMRVVVNMCFDFLKSSINNTNIFDYFAEFSSLEIGYLSSLIKYTAVNFGILSKDQKIHSLPIKILENIMVTDDLDARENDLFDFVVRTVDIRGDDALTLFGAIYFPRVDSPRIQRFIDTFPNDVIQGPVWKSIVLRILCNDDYSDYDEEENLYHPQQVPVTQSTFQHQVPQPQIQNLTSHFQPQFGNIPHNLIPPYQQQYLAPQYQTQQLQVPQVQLSAYRQFIPQSYEDEEEDFYEEEDFEDVYYPPQNQIQQIITTPKIVQIGETELKVQPEPVKKNKEEIAEKPVKKPYGKRVPHPIKSVTILNEVGRDPLDGIFRHILDTQGNPVMDRQIVMDCGGDKRNVLSWMIDSKASTFWWANTVQKRFHSMKDAWFSVRFLYNTLKLTAYSFACFEKQSFRDQPRSWTVKGSNDGVKWTLLDEQTDCKKMNTPKAMVTFDISKSKRSFFTYYCIEMQENWSHSNPNRFYLSKIEFFGELN